MTLFYPGRFMDGCEPDPEDIERGCAAIAEWVKSNPGFFKQTHAERKKALAAQKVASAKAAEASELFTCSETL